ncbi:helix-turn-helix transcriptional regulator [Paenibacillus sp. P36]|uniref:helix-turn-helix transcriptional regulator n=1 Tax=Paenibacillus sp. P36 TaxID=3342538 RepID=UPI0038B31657
MNEQYRNVDQLIIFKHVCKEIPNPSDFHLNQDLYAIYLFLTSDVHYVIENQVYPLQFGDILMISNTERYRLIFQTENQCCEYIEIKFDSSLILAFNSPRFNLLECFSSHGCSLRKHISLMPEQVKDIMKVFKYLEKQSSQVVLPGSEILTVTALIELLVCINRVSQNRDKQLDKVMIPHKLSYLVTFIDDNLDQDLSLKSLEKVLLTNRSYLCRIFKKHMGNTIHEYILLKRIAKAELLLREGATATDTCYLVGFNDYSHFIRTFKKRVGLPPRQYQIQGLCSL